MTKKTINALRWNHIKWSQHGKLRQFPITATRAAIASDDAIFTLFLTQEDCHGRAREQLSHTRRNLFVKSLKKCTPKIRYYSYVIIILQGFPFVNTFPNICSIFFEKLHYGKSKSRAISSLGSMHISVLKIYQGQIPIPQFQEPR